MSAEAVASRTEPVVARRESRLLLLGAIAMVSVLAPLNSTMVAVGLPAIRSDFGVGVGALTGLVVVYLITVAVLQPVAGQLGDALGHLKIIAIGLVLLVAMSAGAALAFTFPMLVIFRGLQGVAAACTMANGVAFVRKRVPAKELGGSLGIIGGSFATGAAAGPAIGAGLVILGGWRWLFLVNVPVSLVALLLITRLHSDKGAGRERLGLDGWSLLGLAGAFTGLALPGITARAGNPALGLAAFGILPASVALFAWRYRATGSGAVDLRLFTRRAYAAGAAATASSNLVMYVLIVSMPIYLGDVRDAATLTIGVLLVCQSVAMVAISPFAGRLADQMGTAPLLLTGAVTVLANQVFLIVLLDDPPVALLAVPLLIFGVGLGTMQPAVQSTALQAWPASMSGSASGTMNMSRYVGSVTGMAIIAAVLGADPGEGAFRALYGTVLVFAVATVVAATVMARARPARREG